MNKIVLMTGSFNPVTVAHSSLLNSAVEELNADLGLFVITNDSYLKRKMIVDSKNPSSFILSEEIRKKMIESLNPTYPKLYYEGIELGGKSPGTEKTLRKVIKNHPNSIIYYLIGADKLPHIYRWTNASDLLDHIHLCVVPRSDVNIPKVIENSELLTRNKEKIHVLKTNDTIKQISSTLLRDLFFNNKDYSHLMDEGPYKIMSQFKPSDFPALTIEDRIYYTLKYGGRFSENQARNLVYRANKELIKNHYQTLPIDIKVYKNRIEPKLPELPTPTKFSVVNEDCINVAESLIESDYNPCMLNLCSEKFPGGGYYKGAGAQEESLCQASNLSYFLFALGDSKYKCVKENPLHLPDSKCYPFESEFQGIYVKKVTFFRDNIEHDFKLRNKNFDCAVVSVPSLANRFDNNPLFNIDGSLTPKAIDIEKNKIRTILNIALDNNHDSLVLGAFGCGAYHLLPSDISRLFDEVFNELSYKNRFKKVIFAIKESSSRKPLGRDGKYKPFYDLFN